MKEIMKSAIIGLAVAIIVSIFVAGVTGNNNQNTQATNNNKATGNVINNNGEYQEVKLTFKNYQYQLEPSNLIKDVLVRLTVDLNTVTGCMRDIVISQFGVKKYVSIGDNVIEFTPNKAGTFNIACSMNMGRGTFTVTELDGTKSNFVEPEVEGSSCGTGAGGCGCGGY